MSWVSSATQGSPRSLHMGTVLAIAVKREGKKAESVGLGKTRAHRNQPVIGMTR